MMPFLINLLPSAVSRPFEMPMKTKTKKLSVTAKANPHTMIKGTPYYGAPASFKSFPIRIERYKT